jgi:hypothetical protein
MLDLKFGGGNLNVNPKALKKFTWLYLAIMSGSIM